MYASLRKAQIKNAFEPVLTLAIRNNEPKDQGSGIPIKNFIFYWDELTRHIAAYASFNWLSHLGTRKHRDGEGRAGREKDSEGTTHMHKPIIT